VLSACNLKVGISFIFSFSNAGFFNLLIENLRQLVMQVKNASTQVNTSLEGDEWAVGQLSFQALRQA